MILLPRDAPSGQNRLHCASGSPPSLSSENKKKGEKAKKGIERKIEEGLSAADLVALATVGRRHELKAVVSGGA